MYILLTIFYIYFKDELILDTAEFFGKVLLRICNKNTLCYSLINPKNYINTPIFISCGVKKHIVFLTNAEIIVNFFYNYCRLKRKLFQLLSNN